MPGTESQAAIRVSIIIPCWNEEKNLERGVLGEVCDYLAGQSFTWEAIIVDDGSSDNSRALVAEFIRDKPGFSHLAIPHGGKPAAIWAGIQAARGEAVLFTDMDQSTPLKELNKLLAWYEQGFDVVIGSRGNSRQGTSPVRKVGSVVFHALRGLFLLREINDTQCGFKLARREAVLRVFPRLQHLREQDRPTGWKVTAYDVELLFLLQKAGCRIKEVAVDWRNRDCSDTKGPSGELARYLHESVEMIQEVMRIKLNQWRGVYDDV